MKQTERVTVFLPRGATLTVLKMPLNIKFAIGLVVILVSSSLIILDLRREHAHSVSIVSTFFWLSFFLTPVLTEAAVLAGVINPNGTASNGVGHFLKDRVLQGSYDVPGEAKFYLAIIAVVLGPQILSFLFCLPYGCASKPRWITTSYKVFVWAMAKACAVAGGVMLSLTVYAYAMHQDWTIFEGVRPSWETVRQATIIAQMAFLAALLILWIGFGCQAIVEFLKRNERVARALERLMAQATESRSEDVQTESSRQHGVGLAYQSPKYRISVWTTLEGKGTASH